MKLAMTLVLTVGISGAASAEEDQAPWVLNKEQQKQILELFSANEKSITPAGIVTLEYVFDEDKPEPADNFFPPVSSAQSARIKWANHHWGYGYNFVDGVVIADKGEWFHEAVWEPDVRMDVEFVSFTTGNPSRKDLVAATYAWSKKNRRRVGSHLGTQLVRLSGVKATAKQGRSALLVHEERSRFGFELKAGKFSTRQMGSVRESTSSKKLLKNLTAGQVGLVWSGGVTGVVEKIQITGRLQKEWIQKHYPEFDPTPASTENGAISHQDEKTSGR